jgi:hypothetical protein
VEALVLLMKSSSQDPHVLGNAVRALWSICSSADADITQRDAGAGAVEALVQRAVYRSGQQPDIHAATPVPQQATSPAAGAPAASISTAAPAPASSSGGPAPQPASASASGHGPPPAVCAVCSRHGSCQRKLRLCGGCRAVRYCGAACQQAHWLEHYRECAAGVQGQGAA